MTERDRGRRDHADREVEWDLVERGGGRQVANPAGTAPVRRQGGDRARLRLTTDCSPGPGLAAVHARLRPDDDEVPGSFTVSIRGVVVRDRRVMLLKNNRQEWELPGGRLEPGETSEQCVVREIAEQAGWVVTCGPILDSWSDETSRLGRRVFTVSYGCHLAEIRDGVKPVLSGARRSVGLFTELAVPGLAMPPGYQRSVARWFAALRARGERGRGPDGPSPVSRSGS